MLNKTFGRINSNQYEDQLWINQQFQEFSDISYDFPPPSILPIEPKQAKQTKQTKQTTVQVLDVLAVSDKNQSLQIKNEQSLEANYKNVCRYIENTIFECLVFKRAKKFEKVVYYFCRKNQCEYRQVHEYYSNNFSKQSLGIGHLIRMISPQNDEQVAIKKVFSDFFGYFLRNRYCIQMLKYGKMQDKGTYIEIKNKLLYLKETIQQSKGLKKRKVLTKSSFQSTITNDDN